MKKYPNRTADRIMAPELQSSAKGGVQVVARQQVNRPPRTYLLLNFLWRVLCPILPS
jgi:hypothetical protein